MSTAFVQRPADARAQGCGVELCHHLRGGLAELFAHSTTPTWIADADGRIVFANLAAARDDNDDLHGAAASSIIAASEAGMTPDASHARVEVSPIVDGHGRRLGWLAFGRGTRS